MCCSLIAPCSREDRRQKAGRAIGVRSDPTGHRPARRRERIWRAVRGVQNRPDWLPPAETAELANALLALSLRVSVITMPHGTPPRIRDTARALSPG